MLLSNVFFIYLINIYQPVVKFSLYLPYWLVLSLAQAGYVAMGHSLSLLVRQNFNMTVILLSGAYVFTAVVGGAYVPLPHMHYVYRIFSLFSIPRFAYHLPVIFLFGFGRCEENEISSMLYMLDLHEGDLFSNFGMLLFNIIFYRFLSLYLLVKQVNSVAGRKKRTTRIVQYQEEMAMIDFDWLKC